MNRRLLLWTGLGAVGLTGAMAAAWVASLPSALAATDTPPIPEGEAEAILDGLKPHKQVRPVIAILGINNATEATDYLMPYGILRRSNVADVVPVATGRGPVKLYPALTVRRTRR